MSSTKEEAVATAAESETKENQETLKESQGDAETSVKPDDDEKEEEVVEEKKDDTDAGIPEKWLRPLRRLETAVQEGEFLVVTEEDPARPFE